ncbi:RagB/SusD family nutrient uptake outer membrane protein [Sphingobacterium sp.]|uniref:RagB/SusD family nutrient uptake outer membrane protein n=1 Tax=Sphingobacterium sp. TaxID=341027 RepID=UPI00289E1AFB|nr:RagB/SusD family nutrient uptake outer membrane protein [Sphingobacterium sp.]
MKLTYISLRVKTAQLLVILIGMFLNSCNKFLDEKSDGALAVPNTLKDLQALLDNNSTINLYTGPGLIELNTDDFFLEASVLNKLTEFDKQAYTWDPNPQFQLINVSLQWRNCYQVIFYANTVLDRLQADENKNTLEYNSLKGFALFLRAYTYFQLTQVYTPVYKPGDETHNMQKLGLPLRLDPSFEDKSQRSSISETYDQVLKDLHEAKVLLPETVTFATRPNKTAAYALLARVYLTMQNYEQALSNANEALARNSTLMDYNMRNTASTTPFETFNPEVIFWAHSASVSMLSPTRANVDTLLYNSYEGNDLRKKVFFNKKTNGYVAFKGNYAGYYSSSFFNGLAVDEQFLIKSECLARLNKISEAKTTLTTLLSMRYAGAYNFPAVYSSQEEVLRYILQERRKELLFRGVRWSDIRRLNQDDRFKKDLTRILTDGGETKKFTLPVGDPRFTFLIPQDVIRTSDMTQNPR